MDQRRELKALLDTSKRALVFTGAGMSTESGIPDFRSPGGVWSKMSPIYFQDFLASAEKRRTAWTRTFSGAAGWTGAKPNDGHYAIARLVKAGKVAAVVTQNVDNLHQDSGVPPDLVIELHGNASYAKCLACGLHHELEDLRGPFLERGEIPACRECSSIVKTATISFGQAMPQAEMERAEEEAQQCDLCIVLGSSLVVFPAAMIPVVAKRNGAALVIINREPTDLDELADLVLHDEIGPTLSEVVPGQLGDNRPH